MQIVLLLWSGNLGGAELVSARLARELRRLGIDARVVFLRHGDPLDELLTGWNVPFESLGFASAWNCLARPAGLAAGVRRHGKDGVLLASCGQLASVLRIGGYRGRIVAVEHGSLLQLRGLPLARRVFHRIMGTAGALFAHAIVAVSDYTRAELTRRPFGRKVVRIYNGIDLGSFAPAREARQVGQGRERPPVIGCASRLVRGKGLLDLIAAASRLEPSRECSVVIAGDGPLRDSIRELAADLRLNERIVCRGWVYDMPEFWRSCDVAVVPTHGLVEGFGMTAAEAMACGKPVVAAACGSLPELVVHDRTGLLFEPGDHADLGRRLATYLDDPTLRARHGARGRERAAELFGIERCAASYAELFS